MGIKYVGKLANKHTVSMIICVMYLCNMFHVLTIATKLFISAPKCVWCYLGWETISGLACNARSEN